MRKHIIKSSILKFFIFLFLSILTCSCEQRKEKIYYVDYYIHSIRIDDDSEYHILAVNSIGESIELHDCDNGYDIHIHYQKANNPILRIRYSDYGNGDGYIIRQDFNGYPKVILPYNYKISTFDD